MEAADPGAGLRPGLESGNNARIDLEDAVLQQFRSTVSSLRLATAWLFRVVEIMGQFGPQHANDRTSRPQ